MAAETNGKRADGDNTEETEVSAWTDVLGHTHWQTGSNTVVETARDVNRNRRP